MDAPTARALVEAAHSRGLLVVAHIEDLNDVRIAITSRVDGLAHIWREGGDAPDVARLVVDHHVFVVPTLAVPDGFVPGTGAALAADPRLRPFLSTEQIRHLHGSDRSSSAPVLRDIAPQIAAVRSLAEAGALLLAGDRPVELDCGTRRHPASGARVACSERSHSGPGADSRDEIHR